MPSSAFGLAVFPHWDDLYIQAKTWQGIYYASQGISPNREIIFEYYLSYYMLPSTFCHFQVTFFEATPDIVEFIYFDVLDGGLSATIGVQSKKEFLFLIILFVNIYLESGAGPYLQIDAVETNVTFTFDTNLGTYTNSSIG